MSRFDAGLEIVMTHSNIAGNRSAKRAKFEELAEARTKRAIKAIRIIANMGGRGRYHYEFDSSDVEKIAFALDKEIDALRQRMISPGRQMDIEFDL